MKKIVLGLFSFFALYSVSAQQQPAYLSNPNFGDTPEQRTENAKLYNAFRTSIGLKDWPQATFELKTLLQSVPKISENLYVKGCDMYTEIYKTATSEDAKKVALDSLLILYDSRAELYANNPKSGKAFILNKKAQVYSQLKPDDKQTLYTFMNDAIRVSSDKLNPELVYQYFSMICEAFKYDEIDMAEYMSRYESLTKFLKESTAPEAPEALASIDAAFASSGAASCENIEKIFRPKYEADPTNNDLLKQILGLFSHSKCENPWQMELLEKYYQNDPQPEFALMLAGVYETRNDYNKALEYITVAINNETEPAEKVKHMLRATGHTLQMGKYREAGEYCKKILEIEPNNAMASKLYADAAAATVNTSGCKDFDKQAAYCLIVDYYRRALNNMTEDDPMREDVNKAIYVYSGNFPKKADLFMMGIEDGTPHNVSCGWVNGRTALHGRD